MASKKQMKRLRKVAVRTNGTVFQHIGASKSKRFRKSVGKLGAASEVRNIDTSDYTPAE